MNKVLGLGTFYGLNDGQCGWSSGGKALEVGGQDIQGLGGCGRPGGGLQPPTCSSMARKGGN